MAWEGAIDRYATILAAAGAACNPAISSISRGEPKAIAKIAHIGYWWGGRRTSSTGGNTLTRVNLEEAITTTIYIPETIRLPSAAGATEDYLRAVVFEIHNRVWADATLGGTCIGVRGLTETEAAWQTVSDLTARTATFICWVDLAEVHVIATT
jgi:uncharacterized membrane protein